MYQCSKIKMLLNMGEIHNIVSDSKGREEGMGFRKYKWLRL